MKSIIMPKTIIIAVIMAIFIPVESRDSFASAEWVYVEKVLSNDDNGIIGKNEW